MSLPLRPRDKTMDTNTSTNPPANSGAAVAPVPPGCSLLVCGLPGAVSAAPPPSSLGWELGPVPDPRINRAILSLDPLGGSITLFRYTPPSFSTPDATRAISQSPALKLGLTCRSSSPSSPRLELASV